MSIEIYPLEKIVLDGVVIAFGMDKAAVEAVIGKGQRVRNRYYYFDNEMAIDYHNDKVEFIEFLCGSDGILRPMIYGVSAFEVQAKDLFEILKEQNKGVIVDHENGYVYLFQNISIGIYREAVPEKVEEMLKEAVSVGVPLSDDEIRHERKKADYWAVIGAGIAGYYQR